MALGFLSICYFRWVFLSAASMLNHEKSKLDRAVDCREAFSAEAGKYKRAHNFLKLSAILRGTLY